MKPRLYEYDGSFEGSNGEYDLQVQGWLSQDPDSIKRSGGLFLRAVGPKKGIVDNVRHNILRMLSELRKGVQSEEYQPTLTVSNLLIPRVEKLKRMRFMGGRDFETPDVVSLRTGKLGLNQIFKQREELGPNCPTYFEDGEIDKVMRVQHLCRSGMIEGSDWLIQLRQGQLPETLVFKFCLNFENQLCEDPVTRLLNEDLDTVIEAKALPPRPKVPQTA